MLDVVLGATLGRDLTQVHLLAEDLNLRRNHKAGGPCLALLHGRPTTLTGSAFPPVEQRGTGDKFPTMRPIVEGRH